MNRLLVVAACLAAAVLVLPSSASANSAPQCENPPLSTPRDTPLEMQADCTDPDGDPIAYGIVTSPQHGGISGGSTPGSAIYHPAPHYVGPDSFTFSAGDGVNPATNVTVSISVVDPDGVNSPPVCPSPHFFVPVGSSTIFSGNCSDPDAGDPIRYFLDSFPDPAVGTLSITSGSSVQFNAVAVGTTSFGYHADDWQAPSDPATVHLDVVPAGGGEFSTGSEATESEPAQASVTTTETGSVIVTQVAAEGTAPAGLTLLPFQYDIEAPSGGSLTLAFTLDASAIPAGHDETTIVVLRDGVPIADCTGTGLGPDPCVSQRTRLADGDVRLVVLSSHASAWNFAVPATVPKRGKGCGDRNHAHEREAGCRKPAR